ncbi:hypothetical protein acsn021_00470 [Anaerocolumna cellulosilytica]|uniref:Uncharacterized protein n=1 Tax=Anaerocolumna cellulosilytica TaxID=433286 RepID=A0A6S6R0G8_9FIRM|nr:DUF5702 domain-containing protein [Anaerocolumna cellulosilytica]MBB5196202.1 hypothetical protein [Anaerocolumna cellulosilytica]BCJ92478.1 hypothetical protein acsn021_00470 [Anaerocolumna cellulosilytica]
MGKKAEGVITVFLSLILLLVMAITMTTIEASRVSAGKVMTERALITAMDSVLAEYYRPLYEEYHIFGLDSGYGTDSTDTDKLLYKMKEYMEYTFEPSKEMERKDYQNAFLLYGIENESLTSNKAMSMLDLEGDLFINQATAYMKYKAVENSLEGFFKNNAALDETKEAQKVLDEKQKTEKSVSKLDEKVLKLMQAIDGISLKKEKTVKVSNNNVVIKDYFVKKINVQGVSMESVGVHNEWVFQSLKSHYQNPTHTIQMIQEDIKALEQNAPLKDEARIQYLYVSLIDVSNKSPEEQKSHYRRLREAKETLRQYEDIERNLIKSVKANIKALHSLYAGVLDTIKTARKLIDEILPLQEEAAGRITAYETVVKDSSGKVDPDFYKGLQEDLETLQRYKGTNEGSNVQGSYNFNAMEHTLARNQVLLEELLQASDISIDTSPDSWEAVKRVAISMNGRVQGYSYDALQFDYSSFKPPEESDSFFQGVKDLIKNGILGLVLDKDTLSELKLEGENLPTDIKGIEESGIFTDLISLFTDMDLEKGTDLLSGFFSGTEGFSQSMETVGNELLRTVLFQEYLGDQFRMYEKEAVKEDKVLQYELEYILMGRDLDTDNLNLVIQKIVLIRMILNLITLCSDGIKSQNARTLAIAFVGFTGMPALISAVKLIILAVWAFVESLVDVAALLEGKKIPVMKKSSQIRIELTDIPAVSRAMIKSKVSAITEGAGALLLSYRDYIKLFLYMEPKNKKSYRALDLIQENIRSKYEKTFYMKNCLTGILVEGEFKMEAKFIRFPIVKDILEDYGKGYTYKVTREYTY